MIRSSDDHLINNVFWGIPDGRRSKGRPRERWKYAVRGDLEQMGIGNSDTGSKGNSKHGRDSRSVVAPLIPKPKE